MAHLGEMIALVSKAFENKTDKAGKPYILHCLRVMNNLHSDDEELNMIAIGHDLIEDTDMSIWDLKMKGFSKRVCDGIDYLTHLEGINYDDYIKRIAFNPDAVKVKLADLKDNSDITRLKGLSKKDFDRIERYHRSFVYLSKL